MSMKLQSKVISLIVTSMCWLSACASEMGGDQGDENSRSGSNAGDAVQNPGATQPQLRCSQEVSADSHSSSSLINANPNCNWNGWFENGSTATAHLVYGSKIMKVQVLNAAVQPNTVLTLKYSAEIRVWRDTNPINYQDVLLSDVHPSWSSDSGFHINLQSVSQGWMGEDMNHVYASFIISYNAQPQLRCSQEVSADSYSSSSLINANPSCNWNGWFENGSTATADLMYGSKTMKVQVLNAAVQPNTVLTLKYSARNSSLEGY